MIKRTIDLQNMFYTRQMEPIDLIKDLFFDQLVEITEINT